MGEWVENHVFEKASLASSGFGFRKCDKDDCKDKKDESSNDVDGPGNIVKS